MTSPGTRRNYTDLRLHLSVPVLGLRAGRSEDLQMPLPTAPGLDDLGGDDVHQNLGKRTPFGVALEMVGRLIPGEVWIQDHRQEQVVPVVDDDDLAAGALDGRVIDQVFLGAMGADVALEREVASDDFLDGDLFFPAVAAIALVAAGLGHVLRPAERAFGL